MRARLLLGVAIAALVAAGPGAAANRVVERGVVQSVNSTALVLRALDGTELTVPVDPATKVRVNGRRGTLAAIGPGFVVEAVRSGEGSAIAVRAFGRTATRLERGRLVRLRQDTLILQRRNGRLQIPFTNGTVVRQLGRRATVRSLRPGVHITVQIAPDGSARLVRVGGARR